MIIDRIPAHIAALPEEQQGPALVHEIHERKAARMAWDHYAYIPAPSYDPFEETRAVLGIDPAGGGGAAWFHVGGRGHGKTARLQAQIEGTRAAVGWLDEHVRLLMDAWRDPHQEVRDLVVRSHLTPQQTITPEVVSVRWPSGRITVN